LLRHEQFEELAAVAARGELTPTQEAELNLHLLDCDQCRQIYQEYEELHAPLRPELDAATEILIESRREKVKAAVLQETTGPQAQVRVHVPPDAPSPSMAFQWNLLRPLWPALAAMVIGLAFWLGLHYERRVLSASLQETDRPPLIQADTPAPTVGAQSQTQKSAIDIQYTQLTSDLRAERERGARLDAELTGKNRELRDSESTRLLLQQRVDSESDELRSTQALLATKTEELRQIEAAKASDSNRVAALQYQVQDLTEKLNDETQSLNRERQLLANGRDIRDIIGARNLHIIDVYDTDAGGNTRKSFARAFYTEGKSLIFYAYDLPARGTEDGKYVYTAWGERNGNKTKVQKLGILLNDDKGQKRWALNFSDLKVLTEIDSVFVTLERVGMDGTEPKGKRMLTAYLDSQLNHP
jgi:hypothetical protein